VRALARRRRALLLGGAALLLVALALGVRLAYLDATPVYELRHDAIDYDAHAQSIALGEGYSERLAHGRPTAFRPPGYPYFLAGVYKLAGVGADEERRVRAARVAQVFVGTAVVALLGLLALQLWGPGTALVATALGAVYVPLVTVGGTVMSEPLFAAAMLGALNAAVAHRHSAHRYRWALLAGLLGGLAILSRANAVVLLLPLALAVWTVGPRLSRRALGPPAALVAVALLVMVPWTLRNARELHAFVPVTTQLGSALAGTYNDQAREDPERPAAWRHIKHVPAFRDLWTRIDELPEVDLERELRRRSLRHIREHPAYVAEVGFWNGVRMLDLAGRDHSRATAATIGIRHDWADRTVWCFWVMAALAVAGASTFRARRAPRWLWLVPALLVASVVFLTLETPRYRTPVDPFVVLLAALAVVTAGERLWRRGRRPAPAAAPARTPPRHASPPAARSGG